MKMRPENLTV